jgi:hypothetical protein
VLVAYHAAFVIIWLLFGFIGAWRHLTVVADQHSPSPFDVALAVMMLLSGPGGLIAHLFLFGRDG